MQRLLLLFALTGCPSQARYVVADVTSAQVPVQGALVAADCGEQNAAQRTDEDGRARMRLYRADADRCSLVVAKPGFPTVETGPVNVCPTATACTPTRVDLHDPGYAGGGAPHVRDGEVTPIGDHQPRHMEVAR